MTAPEHTDALRRFLAGLGELSERTGVAIHSPAPIELDIACQRFAFHATCHDDGTFAYAAGTNPVTAPPHPATTRIDSRRTL